jgi:hypothetical protein
MPFTVLAAKAAEVGPFSCATASDAIDKVLELERRQFENIVVKDDTGRVINLEELSSLCEAGED